jgi:mycothiol synthase
MILPSPAPSRGQQPARGEPSSPLSQAGIWALRRMLARRVRRLADLIDPAFPDPPAPAELQMVWPAGRLASPPDWVEPADYELRTYRTGDGPGFYRVMERAGYAGWNDHELQVWLDKMLPQGFFFAVHRETSQLAASAMACHDPSALHPSGGSLSCVVADPGHRGRGLGRLVSEAATRRLVQGGYRDIYLRTDDWRLPAIRIYLRMGWVPLLFQGDMLDRWGTICGQLGWPLTPQSWCSISPSPDQLLVGRAEE